MPKKRTCELCGASLARALGVDFGTRLIFLCEAHQLAAKSADVRSPEALREMFKESEGRRGLLPRRTDDRRLFPPRPEGRRQREGRRSTD